MKETIENIIKNKSRVVVLSPHFDDAIFSMGGLLNELKNKAEITVVNIFTKQSKPYTISAKKFLSQCGYKDLETLYKDRETEDKKALTQVGAKIINLDFEDALFRKIEKPNLVQKLLGKKLAEFLHIYPTYKFNISKGMVFKNDRANIDKLISIIKDLKLTKNDYLFAPMGIGKHVDHRIANIVGQKMNNETNTIFYADYPYITDSNVNKNKLMNFNPNWKIKEDLLKKYKSQFKAVFKENLLKIDEYFYIQKKGQTRRFISNFIVFVISVIVLSLFIKGQYTIKYFSRVNGTALGSPFELSNSTARYALTESIAKHNTLFLTKDLARFSAPDVVLYKGKFLSIFLPLISFLGVPFYYLGDRFGVAQLSTYALTALAGILNVFLISKLSKKLGATYWSSIIGGLTFLFATNALSYSLGFTQHNISTALILLMLLNLTHERTLMSNFLFGSLFAIGILADIPNPILAFPIVIALIGKIFTFEKVEKDKSKISFNLNSIGYFIGVIPFIGFLVWYNIATTGSFSKLAQNIGRTNFFDKELTNQNQNVELDDFNKVGEIKTNFKLPFNSRKEMDGSFTLLLSNERSWVFYSPVILLGFLGFIYLLRDNETRKFGQVLLSIVFVDIILYSLFGDPYGGWAFGPRYLIPGASLMCIGLSVWLTKNKNVFLYILFCLTLIYSIFVNTLGALTTSAIPPKVEAIHFANKIPYTYEYNWNLINSGTNSSLIYDIYFKNKFAPIIYFYAMFGLITLMFTILNIIYIKYEKSKN